MESETILTSPNTSPAEAVFCFLSNPIFPKDQNMKLDDLNFLKRSPEVLNNVKKGHGHLG